MLSLEVIDTAVGTVKTLVQLTQVICKVHDARSDALELQDKVERLYDLAELIQGLLYDSVYSASRNKGTETSRQDTPQELAARFLAALGQRLDWVNAKLERLIKQNISPLERYRESAKLVFKETFRPELYKRTLDIDFYLAALQTSLQALQSYQLTSIGSQLQHLVGLVEDKNAQARHLNISTSDDKILELEVQNLEDGKEIARSILYSQSPSMSDYPTPNSPQDTRADSKFGDGIPYSSAISQLPPVSPLTILLAKKPTEELETDELEYESEYYRREFYKEIKGGSWVRVQELYRKIVEVCEELEREHETPFRDRIQLCCRLASVHMDRKEFTQAKDVLAPLVMKYIEQRDSDENKHSSDQEKFRQAELMLAFATASFRSFVRHKEPEDLRLAFLAAKEQSFDMFSKLHKSGAIDRADPTLLACANLVVSIRHHRGEHLEAEMFTSRWLVNDDKSNITPNLRVTSEFNYITEIYKRPPDLGETPNESLADAIKSMNIEQLVLLLEHGHSVEELCPDTDLTPMLLAASCEHQDEEKCICAGALRKLKAKGAEFQPKGSSTRTSATKCAIEHSHGQNMSILTTLHELGAFETEVEYERGITSHLEFAIKRDKPYAVKMLLQHHVWPTQEHTEGYTLFHFVAAHRAVETMTMLAQEHGHELTTYTGREQDAKGETPLMLLSKQPESPSGFRIASLLLPQLGVDDVNRKNLSGRSALDMAVSRPPDMHGLRARYIHQLLLARAHWTSIHAGCQKNVQNYKNIIQRDMKLEESYFVERRDSFMTTESQKSGKGERRASRRERISGESSRTGFLSKFKTG